MKELFYKKVTNVLIKTCFIAAGVFSGISCKNHRANLQFSNKDVTRVFSVMTEIMLHDITNPPLSTRFFSYAALAGYEIISQNDSRFPGMHGMLNGYPLIEKPDPSIRKAYRLAALLAMMETARNMQPSGRIMQQFEQRFLDSCRQSGMEQPDIDRSKEYASTVSKSILFYAMSDRYRKISSLPRYAPMSREGSWYPTPPAFMAAVEPYFDSIRPFTLDSCSQFKPLPPIPFDSTPGSAFLHLVNDVYQENRNMPEGHRTIAYFWDCNPYAVQDQGHLQYGLKKISPGAHWMGITGVACKAGNKSFEETIRIYSIISTGLMDAFISCWHEKYRTNRIRPETAIRKYIDPHWQPLLQTPPFPEYLSGHAVISACAAVLLTRVFGDKFAYTDSVETSFGIPPRKFDSFIQAANEAAISRFYGGIHFMDGIENGRLLGIKEGEWIVKKMRL